jgi:hypothetical protein
MVLLVLPNVCTAQQKHEISIHDLVKKYNIFNTFAERRGINTEAESTLNSLLNFFKGNQTRVIYYADLNKHLYMLSQGESNKICCFM